MHMYTYICQVGTSWAVLEASWGGLVDPIKVCFGKHTLSYPLGGVLGPSWTVLEASRASLGRLLGCLRPQVGAFWAVLEVSWGGWVGSIKLYFRKCSILGRLGRTN